MRRTFWLVKRSSFTVRKLPPCSLSLKACCPASKPASPPPPSEPRLMHTSRRRFMVEFVFDHGGQFRNRPLPGQEILRVRKSRHRDGTKPGWMVGPLLGDRKGRTALRRATRGGVNKTTWTSQNQKRLSKALGMSSRGWARPLRVG